MIRLEINYVAFVAPETDAARIAFPKQNHVLKVYLNDNVIHENTKPSMIELVITRKTGFEDVGEQKVNFGKPADMPLGDRVVSIADVAGGQDYELLPTGDLLKGPAQAVLLLNGGRFITEKAQHAGIYTNADWNFGTDEEPKYRKLTDTVRWRITEVSPHRYSLHINGTKVAELKNGDDLRFDNDDAPWHTFPDINGKAVLEEMDLFYDLLVNPPAHRPKPTTEYRGPRPNAPYPAGIDMPLCPVGEP